MITSGGLNNLLVSCKDLELAKIIQPESEPEPSTSQRLLK
ncbi:hypothetical protein SynA1825c_01942 [Synechococcus sp. A18-25c]|nr:hypothetical protein SynA1825c_01942 [Synechococcus sp. A18-25c]